MNTILENKLKRAITIYPQKWDKVNYLFGGDVGISLALNGDIYLRTKKNNSSQSIKDKDVESIDLYSFKHGHYSDDFEIDYFSLDELSYWDMKEPFIGLYKNKSKNLK